MPFDSPSLTLARIALLANVQRPVVSMWRKRSAGSEFPFPQPVRFEGSLELFDAVEVGNWLRVTERGNNPSAAEDAVAFAEIDTTRSDSVFTALTALLCLKVITGEQISTIDAADICDFADDADPEDTYLYREIDSTNDRLSTLAEWADAASTAAYSPAGAFERLLRRRSELAPAQQPTVALSDRAARLIAQIGHSVSGGATHVVDPAPGGSDLLVAYVALPETDTAVTASTVLLDDGASRLARRRLRTHDIHHTNLHTSDSGEFQAPQDALILCHFPSPAAPTMSSGEILSAIDEIALQLTGTQVAVVAAPNSVLTKPLRGTDEDVRAALLRSGVVRVVAALPAGWVSTTPQEQLALWILTPPQPDVSRDARFVMTTDLANNTLDDAEFSDLLTDLTAAVGAPEIARRHSFRFGRLIHLPQLLTYKGSLTDSGTPTSRNPVTGDGVIRRIQRLTAELTDLDAATSHIDVPLGGTATGQRPPTTTVGWLLSSKLLKVVAGTRIDPEHVTNGSGIRVIGPAELCDRRAVGERSIDAAQFGVLYPNAQYTEPGDVIFASNPTVAALVDYEGTSVVEYPARILRLADDQLSGRSMTLLPGVIAAGINALPNHAKKWRSWPVRYTPYDQAEALSKVLRDVAMRHQKLREQTRALEALGHEVYDGVTRRSIELAKPEPDDADL